MRSRTKWAHALLALLFVVMILLEIVEGGQKQAKPRRRRVKKSRAGVGKDFSEFLLVIGAIMTCVIAPVFAFFIHSIYKDPASPELARACWKAIKEKLLSYLGGQQPAMPDSSVGRDNRPDTSSVLRAGRRRKIDTIDNNTSDTVFWAADQGKESQSALPPTTSIPVVDRPQHHRRHPEGDARTEDWPRNGNVRFGRRNYRQDKEPWERPPDPATMAPHSSGALFPTWGAGRGAETRAGESHEVATAPKWWREGGSRTPSTQRAGFRGGKEEYGFGLGGGVEWDPYPDMSYEDEDDDQEPAGRASESRGVYRSARSKRRMSRSKRSRAVKGSSAGAGRGPGIGLDGGWVRAGTMGGRTSGVS